MPLARRMVLLQWARKKNAIIMEDDYNSEFRLAGRPIEPLSNLDADGRVLYMGTFSKTLMPSLRLGFIIVPKSVRPAFIAARLAMDHGRALLEQEALATSIEDGDFERHVRRVRRFQRERRERLLEATARHIGDMAVVHGASGSLHVVLELNGRDPCDVRAVVENAAARVVGIYDLATHFHGRPRFAGLLLGTASLDGDEIEEGIRLLGSALRA